jgi:hypothetical protein
MYEINNLVTLGAREENAFADSIGGARDEVIFALGPLAWLRLYSDKGIDMRQHVRRIIAVSSQLA